MEGYDPETPEFEMNVKETVYSGLKHFYKRVLKKNLPFKTSVGDKDFIIKTGKLVFLACMQEEKNEDYVNYFYGVSQAD